MTTISDTKQEFDRRVEAWDMLREAALKGSDAET